MQLDHLLCLTTWPEFSLIDESPGQKGLDKQNAVFIVKNAGLTRIDGLELMARIKRREVVIPGPNSFRQLIKILEGVIDNI